VIGAVVVSLLSSWFTGGAAPDINLGFYVVKWTDWWLVLLGVSFVLVTLLAPKGIGGLVDMIARAPAGADRHGADFGPDRGSKRESEQ